MEFLDEESRPRILFQSRAKPTGSAAADSKSMNKVLIFVNTFVAIIIFGFTFFYVPNYEPLTSILLWIAISILTGPFASSSITGGNVRVGNGSVLEDLKKDPVGTEARKPKQQRGGNPRQNEEHSWRSDASMRLEKRDSIAESEKRDADF